MTDRLREQLENVSIPAGGRERVLAQLAREWQTISLEPAQHPASVQDPASLCGAGSGIGHEVSPAAISLGAYSSGANSSGARWTRRGVLASAVCAAGLLIAGGWWLAAPRLESSEIEQAVVASTSQEGAVDLTAEAGVPYTWDWPKSFDASLLRTARRSLVNVRGCQIVVLSFDLRRSRGVAVPGWFVVVPARWLKAVPGASGFLGGEFSYSQRHTATWWIEGQYAYACGLGTGDTRLFDRCLPQRWAT